MIFGLVGAPMASQVADAQRVMAKPARIVPPRSAAKGFRMGKFPTIAGGIASDRPVVDLMLTCCMVDVCS